MEDDRNPRERLSDAARRALRLYTSDTAYQIAVRLALLLCLTVFLLSFFLGR
jgi:hypothetical protein